MKTIMMAEVIDNKQISEEVFDICISAPAIAKDAKAGQVVDFYTGKGEYLLPRPISICEIDKTKGTLRLVFQVVGKGTAIFSKLQKGDTVKIVGPLGNGFDYSSSGCSAKVVIGGGIGVPPLLQLVKELQGKVYVFLGSRTNPILVDDFKSMGVDVYVATDDGSEGFHGNVLELVKRIGPKVNEIYSCGPKVMLKSVSQWASEKGVSAQVSMEERMACGIGACVGCAIKIKRKGESDWTNLKVCKDGPVFLSDEVVWDE